MKLKEEQKERLRTLTVELVLDLYTQAIRSGWNPLDLWDQVANRLRAAVNVTQTPEEWLSDMLRKLRLSAPSKDSSASLIDLSSQVREWGCASAWLDLVEREHGLLVALARKVNEERRDARNAARNATTTQTQPEEMTHV